MLERFQPESLRPGDLEILRLVLAGESVIDWRRLHFADRTEVDGFLRANLFDTRVVAHERRLRAILAQAVDYLRRTFRYRVAEQVAHPAEIHDLFLLASGVTGPEKLRRIACVVLKVMHTVHHIEARELFHQTRVSEAELGDRADRRVRAVVERLRTEEGLPITAFEGNAKARLSVITKLLSKRENVAAPVFDRHRYRVVVRDEQALVSVVLALAHELFPFNYVVPGQTQNTLIPVSALAGAASELPDSGVPTHGVNEFSGHSYRILNFIVDMPVALDPDEPGLLPEGGPDLGHVVFAPVELQVVDEATARTNEEGENSHARYKKRQLRRVLGRLSRGLVVPRRRRSTEQPS